MKLNIVRKVEERVTIDVKLPYFYKHDLMLDEIDIVIYGKIEESRHVSVKVLNGLRGTCASEKVSFELEIEHRPAASLAEYFESRHCGTEGEFKEALSQMMKAAQAV